MSGDDETGAQVIYLPFGGRAPGPSVTSERPRYPECQHDHARVNSKLRTVKCRDCGEKLDPVTVLLHVAKAWDRYERSIEECKYESNQAHEQLEDVKRRLRNARAKLKRAEGKSK
jgi:hypothetical protein